MSDGGRDWQAWHRHYDDPASSLSRRLEVVRARLETALRERLSRAGDVTLVSLCAGDGRDSLPVIAGMGDEATGRIKAVLVELDANLAEAARESAADLGLGRVVVHTADAGRPATFAEALPADVLMLCGVFGNVEDHDVRRTVAAVPSALAPGGTVLWTRGASVDMDPTRVDGDPAEWVRERFADAGLVETAFVHPSDADFRVGVHRLVTPADHAMLPDRLFTFV